MSPRGTLVGVSDLLRRPGSRRELSHRIESEGYRVAGSEVPAGTDVSVELVLESTADPGTLTAHGTISAPWTGECRRCLEAVEGTLEIDVAEVFSRSPEDHTDDDVWPLEGEQIDLGAVVADAVLLALPLAPLCRAECAGPSPEEFPATVEGDVDDADDADGDDADDGEEPPRDPRWAALDELRFD